MTNLYGSLVQLCTVQKFHNHINLQSLFRKLFLRKHSPMKHIPLLPHTIFFVEGDIVQMGRRNTLRKLLASNRSFISQGQTLRTSYLSFFLKVVQDVSDFFLNIPLSQLLLVQTLLHRLAFLLLLRSLGLHKLLLCHRTLVL